VTHRQDDPGGEHGVHLYIRRKTAEPSHTELL